MVLADQDLRRRRIHGDGLADVVRPDARIAHHGAAQRDEVVQQRTGVLRHVEHAELRIEHVHLGRRLGLGRELEDDLDAVDGVLLDRLTMLSVGAISPVVPRAMPLPSPASTWPRGPRGSMLPNWNCARRAIGMPASTFSPDTASMKPSGAIT